MRTQIFEGRQKLIPARDSGAAYQALDDKKIRKERAEPVEAIGCCPNLLHAEIRAK
jgi:hypothetical protein